MAVEVLNDDTIKKVVESNDKIIVKFYASWCGSCKLLDPKYNRLSAEDNYNEVGFYKLDAEANQEARKMVGVNSLPFIATFKNGELLDAKATTKEERIVEMLERL